MISMRLTQLGRLVRSRLVVTTDQPLLLGTTAIAIDGEQSSCDDSFSRNIQIRSVLVIVIFANLTSGSSRPDPEESFQPAQP